MPDDILVVLLPLAVAVGVPAVFLYAVRRLDLHASGGFRVVVACFAAGLAAFPVAFVVNTAALRWLVGGGVAAAAALLVIKTTVAPAVEEVLKSTGLVSSVRRPDFRYFVDGAIYGFAAGTAFAIFENVFYVFGSPAPLALSVNRAFSTSLMHGSACALVGVALGRARFGRGRTRFLALLIGWAAAIALHMLFNRLVNTVPLTPRVLAYAVLVGFGGVALTVAFIRWGLSAERAWMRETLSLAVGVSAGEAKVVQRLSDLGTLLAPVEAHFGRAKRGEVEAFLKLQAQLGIQHKAATLAADPALRATLAERAEATRRAMDAQRRAVGVYCMAYVRSILPSDAEPIWDRLNQALAEAPPPSMDLWRVLADRQAPPGAPATGSAGAGPTTGPAAAGPTPEA